MTVAGAPLAVSTVRPSASASPNRRRAVATDKTTRPGSASASGVALGEAEREDLEERAVGVDAGRRTAPAASGASAKPPTISATSAISGSARRSAGSVAGDEAWRTGSGRAPRVTVEVTR